MTIIQKKYRDDAQFEDFSSFENRYWKKFKKFTKRYRPNNLDTVFFPLKNLIPEAKSHITYQSISPLTFYSLLKHLLKINTINDF